MKVCVAILLLVVAVYGSNIDRCNLDGENACWDYSTAESCQATNYCKSVIWAAPSNNTKICQMCLDDVKNLQKFISAKTTRVFVKSELLEVCDLILFEAPRNKCITNVNKNFDKIYQDIVNKLDPNVVCRALRLCCSKDIHAQLTDQIKESLLSGIDADQQCFLDGENACRDYSSAERCDAIEFCKSTVWNQPINNTTKLCQMCLDDVANLEKFISAKSTRSFVKNELLMQCNWILFEAARNKCISVINENFDKIYQDLVDKLDPNVICRALLFCFYSPKETVSIELPTSLDIKQCKFDSENACIDYSAAEKCHATDFCKSFIWNQPVNNNTKRCQMCLDDVTNLQQFIEAKTTKDYIKSELLAMCHALPFEGMRTRCTDTINTNFDVIYQDLIKKLDPEMICRALRFCQSKDSSEMILREMKKVLSDTDINLPAIDDNTCAMCKIGFEELEKWGTHMPKDMMKKQLMEFCDTLPDPTERKECRTRIDQDFDMIYEEVLAKTDPAVICKNLGVCEDAKTMPTKLRAFFESL